VCGVPQLLKWAYIEAKVKTDAGINPHMLIRVWINHSIWQLISVRNSVGFSEEANCISTSEPLERLKKRITHGLTYFKALT
jgi:hypothetical protein